MSQPTRLFPIDQLVGLFPRAMREVVAAGQAPVDDLQMDLVRLDRDWRPATAKRF
jgi:hypothetical protein